MTTVDSRGAGGTVPGCRDREAVVCTGIKVLRRVMVHPIAQREQGAFLAPTITASRFEADPRVARILYA